jgi:hypothetical protein
MIAQRRIFQAFTVAIFLSASASFAHASSFYVQRKVESRQFPIRSACFMPPAAQLTKLGMKNAEQMVKESNDWAAALQLLVESHLNSDGITINAAANPFSSGASDGEIQQVISQIQQKYGAISPLMDKKPGEIAKSAYTLGDQVAMLPCSATSDVLVFVTAAGTAATESREAVSGLIGGPTSVAIFIVTMADAKTGEILGLVRIHLVGDFLSSAEDAFGQGLDDNLADMNIGSARKKAKSSGH